MAQPLVVGTIFDDVPSPRPGAPAWSETDLIRSHYGDAPRAQVEIPAAPIAQALAPQAAPEPPAPGEAQAAVAPSLEPTGTVFDDLPDTNLGGKLQPVGSIFDDIPGTPSRQVVDEGGQVHTFYDEPTPAQISPEQRAKNEQAQMGGRAIELQNDPSWKGSVARVAEKTGPMVRSWAGATTQAVGDFLKWLGPGLAEDAKKRDEAAQEYRTGVPKVKESPGGDAFTSMITKAGEYLSTRGKDVADKAKFYLDVIAETAPPEIRKRVLENPEVLKDPRWWIENVGEGAVSFIPTIVAHTLGGGWASGAVGGAMEGSSLYRDLLEPEKDKAGKTISPAVDKPTALLAATAYGLTSGALNAMGMEGIFGKEAGKSAIRRIIHGGAKGAMSEGTTEYAEELFQAMYEGLARGDSVDQIVARIKESAKNVEVGISAGALGGVGGGVHGYVDKGRATQPEPALDPKVLQKTLEEAQKSQPAPEQPAAAPEPVPQAAPAPVATARPVPAVVANAAEAVGISPALASSVISAESRGNPTAKNPKSSAYGMGQMIDETWDAMVAKHGERLGVTKEMRNDPQAQALLSAAYLKDIQETLRQKLGREPSDGEVYMGYFLGEGGGVKFLKNLAANPQTPALAIMGAKVANANESIFYVMGKDENGKPMRERPRSLGEVFDLMSKKVDSRKQASAAPAPQVEGKTEGMVQPELDPELADSITPEDLQMLQETATEDGRATVEKMAPESQKTINAQLAAILDPKSTKDTMLVTEGSPMPQNIPDNVIQAVTDKGIVLSTNPQAVESLKQDTSIENIGRWVLNFPHGKELSLDRVVRALDADGMVVGEIAVPQAREAQAVDVMKGQSPIGKVDVVPAIQGLNDRQALVREEQQAALKLPEQGAGVAPSAQEMPQIEAVPAPTVEPANAPAAEAIPQEKTESPVPKPEAVTISAINNPQAQPEQNAPIDAPEKLNKRVVVKYKIAGTEESGVARMKAKEALDILGRKKTALEQIMECVGT